ncbi:MAG: heavy-metal-associated domain-containing protein [Desulfovibrionaceae bacterium]|nr:heavy-metal-associated domain-containing protein [Desulfovibrionaceae bacterium]
MTTIKVQGMSCEHCRRAVTEAVRDAGGSDVSVSLEAGEATFTAATPETVEKIKNAVRDAGYTVP